MGEVYRAYDPTLRRDVAIKVVLDAFAPDVDRLRRLEREALATAALSHPNILAVYDIGTQDGLTYIVSELLEGQTLRELLPSRGLPPRRAARYATQIAAGLAAAHDKDIVHRDIKPANLFVTTDDRVKILDFGLARLVSGSLDDASTGSTATGLTIPGAILGTAGYMAPEQVRGEVVDRRADIFSLGAVLYEMLAGRRAFHRDTVAGTLAAIVEADPPSWTGDGSGVAQRLMRFARRCLEKAPDQRFQSARDLALVLADETDEESPGLYPPKASGFPWRAIAATAVITAAAGAAVGLPWPGSGSGSAPSFDLLEFEVSAPAGITNFTGPVLSRDGRRLAFVADGRLYIREIDSYVPRAQTGGEADDVKYPFFSPDGRRIGFFSGDQLRIATLDGGQPFVVCGVHDPRGGTWTDDDRIVFAEAQKGLSRVSPAPGAARSPLTSLNTGERDHRLPQALAGSDGILFEVNYEAGGFGLGLLRGGTTSHTILLPHGANPMYAAGRLFYVGENEEFVSAPFDTRSLTISGPAAVRPERIASAFNLGSFAYSVAANGALAYQPFVVTARSVQIVGRGGTAQPIGKPGPFSSPRVSPDGSRLAVATRSTTGWGDVLIGDTRGSFQPLTTDGASRLGAWDPTGEHLIIESQRDGHSAIWVHDIQTRQGRKLLTSDAYPVSILRDGRMLVGLYNVPGRPSDELNLVSPGDARIERLPLAVTRPAFGRISADSRWLAYTTDESGQFEVYVTAFPTPGRTWQVSEAGSGQRVVWAKSGGNLYYLRNDGEVMMVTISASGPSGRPQSAGVGTFPLAGFGPGDPQYDTLPDGRFVVIRSLSETAAPQPIIVVQPIERR